MQSLMIICLVVCGGLFIINLASLLRTNSLWFFAGALASLVGVGAAIAWLVK